MNKLVLVTNQFSVVVKGLEKKLKSLFYEVKLVDNGFMGLYQDDYYSDAILLYLTESLIDNSHRITELNMICDNVRKYRCGLILIDADKSKDMFIRSVPMLRDYTWLQLPIDIPLLSEAILTESNREFMKVSKKEILIVDDDPMYGTMVSKWLMGEYVVSTVPDGMQAISFLTNNKVDLILLDYEMPVVDGPQILEMLRTHPETRDIPVMFLTSIREKDRIQRVVKLKPEGYILKSATKDEILKNLADYFKRH